MLPKPCDPAQACTLYIVRLSRPDYACGTKSSAPAGTIPSCGSPPHCDSPALIAIALRRAGEGTIFRWLIVDQIGSTQKLFGRRRCNIPLVPYARTRAVRAPRPGFCARQLRPPRVGGSGRRCVIVWMLMSMDLMNSFKPWGLRNESGGALGSGAPPWPASGARMPCCVLSQRAGYGGKAMLRLGSDGEPIWPDRRRPASLGGMRCGCPRWISSKIGGGGLAWRRHGQQRGRLCDRECAPFVALSVPTWRLIEISNR